MDGGWGAIGAFLTMLVFAFRNEEEIEVPAEQIDIDYLKREGVTRNSEDARNRHVSKLPKPETLSMSRCCENQ